MKPDWWRKAREAISRNDHRNVLAGAVAGLGAAIAIGIAALLAAAVGAGWEQRRGRLA